jgi:hypothetical protein
MATVLRDPYHPRSAEYMRARKKANSYQSYCGFTLIFFTPLFQKLTVPRYNCEAG